MAAPIYSPFDTPFITIVCRGADDSVDSSWMVKSADVFRASLVIEAFFANPRSLERSSSEFVIEASSKEAVRHFIELVEYPKYGGPKFADLASTLNVGLIAELIDRYDAQKVLMLAKDLVESKSADLPTMAVAKHAPLIENICTIDGMAEGIEWSHSVLFVLIDRCFPTYGAVPSSSSRASLNARLSTQSTSRISPDKKASTKAAFRARLQKGTLLALTDMYFSPINEYDDMTLSPSRVVGRH